MDSLISLILGSLLLLSTGLFVIEFLGGEVLMKSAEKEEKITQSTEKTVEKESTQLPRIEREIEELAREVREIHKDIEEVKKETQ